MNISDKQVRDLTNLFYAEQARNDLNSVKAMRAALEAYERTRAPDPRVVELVEAARQTLASGEDWDQLRAALAAMGNGNV